MKAKRGRRLGAAALLLAAAAPAAWLLPYEYEVITGEGCLAPAFAGPDCAHFRRIAGLDSPRVAPADIPAEVQLPHDVRSLLLASNELAGAGPARPARLQRQRR